MPTGASPVTSKQALSTPSVSLFVFNLLYQGFGCVGFRPIDWQAKCFMKRHVVCLPQLGRCEKMRGET
jgi:hypothetical protein